MGEFNFNEEGYLVLSDESEEREIKFGKSSIWIKPLNAYEAMELRSKHLKKIREGNQWVEKLDETKYWRAVVNRVLIRWDKVIDGRTGKEIPCTHENKGLLIERLADPTLARIVLLANAQRYVDLEESELELELKNSKLLSSNDSGDLS